MALLPGIVSAATINAASCSQADVQAAVNSAQDGDTVLVPAGTCVWTTNNGVTCYDEHIVGVCIRKGIKFQGGVGGETVITFGPGFTRGGLQINPGAVSLSNDAVFEVTGFTFDGNGQTMGNEGLLSIRSSGTVIMSNLKVYNNTFKSVTSKAVVVNGAVNGVIYENTFTDVDYSVTAFGYDINGWNTFERVYGGADNLFVEDNIINFTTDMIDVGGTDHGQGAPGFVFRYNTFDMSRSSGGWFFTIHGLQSMAVSAGYTCPSGCGYDSCSPSVAGSCNETAVVCEQWSTIKSEYYGNRVVNASYLHSFMGHRGSWLMMFYNDIAGIGSPPTLGYAQYACDSCQSPSTPAYSQHVQNSYIFRNIYNSANVKMTKALDYCADAAKGTPYVITENVDYWNENSNFDGTTGVGIGRLADMPSTCTVGVGYWATNKSISDFTGMTGIHPTTPISGTFYKCTATDTWTSYYTPYTYPHPLRGGSTPPAVVPGDLNMDGVVDVFDLLIIANDFGKTIRYDSRADTDINGIIDIFDAVFVTSRFN